VMVLSVIRLSLLYGSNYQHLTITITLHCVLCEQAQVLTIRRAHLALARFCEHGSLLSFLQERAAAASGKCGYMDIVCCSI